MPRYSSVLFLLLPACWMDVERDMMERADTMEGHLTALFDATDALQAEDGGAFKSAMKDLEHGGEVPGVEVGGALELLHAQAKRARQAGNPGERAKEWSTLALQCGSCHAAHDIQTPVLFESLTVSKQAAAAIVWQDDALWTQSQKALGLPEHAEWAARAGVLGAWLGSVPFDTPPVREAASAPRPIGPEPLKAFKRGGQLRVDGCPAQAPLATLPPTWKEPLGGVVMLEVTFKREGSSLDLTSSVPPQMRWLAPCIQERLPILSASEGVVKVPVHIRETQ